MALSRRKTFNTVTHCMSLYSALRFRWSDWCRLSRETDSYFAIKQGPGDSARCDLRPSRKREAPSHVRKSIFSTWRKSCERFWRTYYSCCSSWPKREDYDPRANTLNIYDCSWDYLTGIRFAQWKSDSLGEGIVAAGQVCHFMLRPGAASVETFEEDKEDWTAREGYMTSFEYSFTAT